MVEIYKIFDIKEWSSEESHINLPVMQRGYVWKPYQIERMWDSILRGFPIGTFIMSKVNETNKQLLDGQQRSTSIILGFYNPWNKNNFSLKNVKNLPVVWIDLQPTKIDGREFVLRVVTQSHPWGYRLDDNSEILSVANRREALGILDIKDEAYTKLSPECRLPYDSYLPIPFAFALEPFVENKEISYENWRKYIIESVKSYFPGGIKTKYTENTKYIDDINNCDFNDLYTSIKECTINYEIPSIEINSDIITRNNDYTSFVRINTEGTKLTEEELIYSIYKSKYPDTKDIVESISQNIISPAKTITIVSKLAYSNINNGNYIKDINIDKFQELIGNEGFKGNLSSYIKNNYSIKNLYEKALCILKNNGVVPNVVLRQIICKNINLFTLLLHWLEKNTDVVIDEKLRKNICARFYRMIWFGDSSTFVKEMWNKVNENEFWSIPLNGERFIELPLINANTLKKYLLSRFVYKESADLSIDEKTNPDIWSIWENEINDKDPNGGYITKNITDWWAYYINKVLFNRSFVQIVQHEYIERSFREFNQIELLEDTNAPWDWDHIYPSSWIYNKRNIPQPTRFLNGTIGNLRILSLSDNRSQGDAISPAERLDADSFVLENDKNYWEQITKRIDSKDSFENHSLAIIERIVNIYDYCCKNLFNINN